MYLCIPFRKGGIETQKFIDNGACGDIEKTVSVLSSSPLEERTEFIDNTERDNEVKRD